MSISTKQSQNINIVSTVKEFSVPTKAEVSADNQAIFNNLEKGLGFVPNIYAYFAKSETALASFLASQNRKSTLSNKEKEVINIAASQINGCNYCLSAHTAIGKMNGFTNEQILEIRTGNASFDSKLDALAKFAASVVNNRGRATAESKEAFFAAGFSEANLVDVVFVIGEITITNFTHNLTGFTIDFPLAPELEAVVA